MNRLDNLWRGFTVWFNNQHTWGTWCCLAAFGIALVLAYVVIRSRPKD